MRLPFFRISPLVVFSLSGGNAATGESTHYDPTLGANTQYCPDYAVRSSDASSCQTMRRRAINLNPCQSSYPSRPSLCHVTDLFSISPLPLVSPDWSVNRQAVIRRNVDGSGMVVPQAKSTGKDWRMRR